MLKGKLKVYKMFSYLKNIKELVLYETCILRFRYSKSFRIWCLKDVMNDSDYNSFGQRYHIARVLYWRGISLNEEELAILKLKHRGFEDISDDGKEL